MTTWAFVRHGQTDQNLHKRIQGQANFPLNDTGRAQAREAGVHLGSLGSWDAIYASTLDRAVETAQIIADELGVPFSGTLPELIEKNYGDAEGVSYAGMSAEEKNALLTRGEPEAEVVARMRDALSRIEQSHRGGRVIVVSHGTALRLALGAFTGSQYPRFENGDVRVHEFTQIAKSEDSPSN